MKNFISDMKSFLEYVLNSIYKKNCIVCNCSKEDGFLCKNCSKDVQKLNGFAHRIYKGVPIYSAFVYENTIKTLIQKLKFSYKKESAKVLAHMLFDYFKDIDIDKNDLIIVYPDTFYLKRFKRGYNSTYLIALEFAKTAKIEIEKDVILKIKYTKPQYKARNRVNNIKGSFKINENKIDKIKDKNILLFDDITTSGATINEIINCFEKVKIKNIVCLTLSKTRI